MLWKWSFQKEDLVFIPFPENFSLPE